jgi:predicted Zn-dependent protease
MIDSPTDPPNNVSEAVNRKTPLVYVLLLAANLVAGCAEFRQPDLAPPETSAASAKRATENPAQTTAAPQTETAPAGSSPSSSPAPAPAEVSEDETEKNQEPPEEEDEEEEDEEKRQRRIVLDTVYDDKRVGADQTKLIEAELGLVQDEDLNRFVRSVALRLLRYAPPRPFDYEFKIVDQSVPNAFALPGGKIYVSRGLLALVTSEDELAGVLGHEIIHAAERHASARIDYSSRLNPFTISLLRAAAVAAYGRDQERAADQGGQTLAARAGYDPIGISTFLRKLDASERYKIGWSRMPYFLATHPTSPERSALASERAAALEWTAKPGISSSEPDGYYGAVDGLIIGDDPAGGLFDKENRFVHPELRFSIRFPQGWETMNTQQAVRALSPNKDAQVTLSAAGAGDESLDEIVDEFIESEFEGLRIRVNDRREVRLGELPAVRIEGRASNGLGSLSVQMTFVRHGDLVYRLTMLSLADSISKFRGRARAFAHSFRLLEDDGVRSLKVTRLRTARALEGETLQQLSVRTRNQLELVFTAVLNGLFASSTLPRQTPIKIGIEEPYLPKPIEPEGPEGPEGPAEDSIKGLP